MIGVRALKYSRGNVYVRSQSLQKFPDYAPHTHTHTQRTLQSNLTQDNLWKLFALLAPNAIVLARALLADKEYGVRYFPYYS